MYHFNLTTNLFWKMISDGLKHSHSDVKVFSPFLDHLTTSFQLHTLKMWNNHGEKNLIFINLLTH